MKEELASLSRILRLEVIRMSCLGKAPHLGSSLSCLDLLIVLYWKYLQIDPQTSLDPTRDRFILSKGHAISSLYAVLAYKGFFPIGELSTFNKDGSRLPEHPSPQCVPGVEVATGSLGHGLSLGLGLSLSAKIQKLPYKTVVLLSDGECNEGSVWEAALLAPTLQLDNLTVLVDFNKWQATGRSEEVTSLSPLEDKWRAFGWEVEVVDGHSFLQIETALQKQNLPQKPRIIIAHTVKGKGIPFMEDDNNWHYRIPTEKEVSHITQLLGL